MIEHCDTFIVFGSAKYGEDTGNPASTYHESKFAQDRNNNIILIRMIPYNEEFEHPQARFLVWSEQVHIGVADRFPNARWSRFQDCGCDARKQRILTCSLCSQCFTAPVCEVHSWVKECYCENATSRPVTTQAILQNERTRNVRVKSLSRDPTPQRARPRCTGNKATPSAKVPPHTEHRRKNTMGPRRGRHPDDKLQASELTL